MTAAEMTVRAVTDEDVEFWTERSGTLAVKVDMRGDHIGAENIEVVRVLEARGHVWAVPFVLPDADGITFWFMMWSATFPPVAALAQPPVARASIVTVEPAEREEWKALEEADTLHMLPTEALSASVKHLAARLLALTTETTCTT